MEESISFPEYRIFSKVHVSYPQTGNTIVNVSTENLKIEEIQLLIQHFPSKYISLFIFKLI